MKKISICGISGATDFHSLWTLPQFPLTERFGAYRRDHKDLSFDQELVISLPTGHVQLRYQMDPGVLYTPSAYSFRTGASGTARSSTAFFCNFLRSIAKERKFLSMVDIGGNDLFLAKEISDCAATRTVIDPICSDIDQQVVDGIRVIGRFVEQVDLSSDIERPDLVVFRHTLEHIAEPRKLFGQLFQQCSPDCLYVAEVPCFENLVEAMRFDAIFHQHFQYYDLAAFRHLLWECGGEYVAHSYNHQGSCGGALLVAFRRATAVASKPEIDVDARIHWIEKRISAYTQQMALMGQLLKELPRPVYGYGAGLMMATLAYHLGTDFSELDCVLDDDPSRDGWEYENVHVTVRHPSSVDLQPNSSYVITSLENVRPIARRIVGLQPRRVLQPLLA